jgi:putative ABC transport system permease protein
MKLLILILKNVRRNLLRSSLTALGSMFLVLVVTLVWTILGLLDAVTKEKKQDLKAIVSERWAIPSRMPPSYADRLADGAAQGPDDVRPSDWMGWQFYGGTVDPANITRDSIVFAIGCEPDKLATMMDGLEDLPAADHEELMRSIERLKKQRQGIIVGFNHLVGLQKQIGERIKLHGIGNFKGLDLEMEVVGVFPRGRYDNLAAFHREYLSNAIDAFPKNNAGRTHPLADRTLNLVWLKVRDTAEFNRLAAQIENSPLFSVPAVKCETASSGMAAWMEAFRDLIWGMRWLLAPACLVTLAVILAIAISISVRERRTELAVLKVLGFGPTQILILVLGEAILLGAGSGFASTALTYVLINWVAGGFSFPIAFFDRFMIPTDALWWGPVLGGTAAFVGSFLPAWTARNVKAAEVFARVT